MGEVEVIMEDKKSTHKALVYEITLINHPKADKLSLVNVDGYTICVRTEDWNDGDLAVHIQPDTLVPNEDPFSFLASDDEEYIRVRPIKLRGVWSEGLLIPAPDGANIGDDLWDEFKLKRFVPKPKLSGGGDEDNGPKISTYDLEPWEKYGKLFRLGEKVIVSEKIHGANMKVVYLEEEDRFCVGSRNNWWKESEKNYYWRAFRKNKWIEAFLEMNPSHVLFGEVFGKVQELKYGINDDVDFRAFDLLDINPVVHRFLTRNEVSELKGAGLIKWVPTLWVGCYYPEKIREIVSGDSLIEGADNIREGVVVEALDGRDSPEFGRLKMKYVSNEYLGKDNK